MSIKAVLVSTGLITLIANIALTFCLVKIVRRIEARKKSQLQKPIVFHLPLNQNQNDKETVLMDQINISNSSTEYMD